MDEVVENEPFMFAQSTLEHHMQGVDKFLAFAEPVLTPQLPQFLRLEEAFQQMLQAKIGTPGRETDGTAQDATEILKTMVVAWVRHPGPPFAQSCA